MKDFRLGGEPMPQYSFQQPYARRVDILLDSQSLYQGQPGPFAVPRGMPAMQQPSGESRKQGQNEKSVIVQNFMAENPEYFTHSQMLNIQTLQPRSLPKECVEIVPQLTLKYNEILGVEEQLDTALMEKIRDLEGELYISQQSEIQYAPLNVFHIHFGYNKHSIKTQSRQRRGFLLELRLNPRAVDTQVQPFFAFFRKVEIDFVVEKKEGLEVEEGEELGPELRQKTYQGGMEDAQPPQRVVWEFEKNKGVQMIQSGKGEEERQESVISNFENPSSFVTTSCKSVQNIFDRNAAVQRSGGEKSMGGISVFTEFKLGLPSPSPAKLVAQHASQYRIIAKIKLYPQGEEHFFELKSEALIKLAGMKYATRSQVIGAVWEYVKSRKLQDPENINEVLADELLASALSLKDPHITFSSIVVRLQKLLKPSGPIHLTHVIDLGENWRRSEERFAIKTLPLKNRTLLMKHLVTLKKESEEVKQADMGNVDLLSRLHMELQRKKNPEQMPTNVLENQTFKVGERSERQMKEIIDELKSKIRAYNFYKSYSLNPGPTLKAALLDSNDALEVRTNQEDQIMSSERYQTQKFSNLERRKPTAFFKENESWLLEKAAK